MNLQLVGIDMSIICRTASENPLIKRSDINHCFNDIDMFRSDIYSQKFVAVVTNVNKLNFLSIHDY